jgi:hypothetical protein
MHVIFRHILQRGSVVVLLALAVTSFFFATPNVTGASEFNGVHVSQSIDPGQGPTVPPRQQTPPPAQQPVGGGGQQVGGGGQGVGGGGQVVSNPGRVDNPLRFPTIQAFFQAIIEFLLILALPFIVFMIIYTGFLFVTARGDTHKLQTAKNMLMWTIIGGMLILGATIIAEVIRNTVDNITLLTEVIRFL